ncbi:gastric triacylglycerol lipase [Aplysia californica]|uniref:Lipase n=1 Tax=Aplysia californica TaxID=6500 RepID=A0ABM1VVD2_APLCA|nr:gastric triacylglycerol lipase [Aplysia californica]
MSAEKGKVGIMLEYGAWSEEVQTELITSKGFPCENHYVPTEDGYILNILRIPQGRKNSEKSSASRPVVVLQHGLLGSCTNFLTNPVNESLAYLLADAGADVWLGNSRGNIYSTNHTHLSPNTREFWNFSWGEMARFDLPAMINFIRDKTGADQVYYVGHSQGTTMAFAQFSEDQELASHIKHFFALAPAARVGHTSVAIAKLAPFANEIKAFFDMLGPGEFLCPPRFLRYLQGELCLKWGTEICENLLFLAGGFDPASLNQTRIPVYMAHNPAGTSTTNILHWAQMVNSKEFQKFDYGSPEANMRRYNQPTPPLYYPSNMKVPVAVFRGGHDLLANKMDVNWLLPQLNVSKDVYVKRYEHLDFIWAFDAPSVIYKYILEIVFSLRHVLSVCIVKSKLKLNE